MSIRNVLFVFVCACGGEKAVSPVVQSTPEPAVPANVETAVPDAMTMPEMPATAGKPVAEVPAKADPAAVPEVPGKYADAMALGKQLEATGDHANARIMFEAAAKLDRKRAEPHVELARSFIATDDRSSAMAAANKAVKLAPDSTGAWNTLGRAELLRKNYDGAITAFQKAVELDRDNAWAWNNLGFVQLETKHYDAALASLVEATNRPAATGYMWNNLGTAYEQLDRLDEAREAFEKGGALGSKEALSSRKRLDGVKTVAIAQPEKPAEADQPVQETVPPVAEQAGSDVEAPAAGSGSDAAPATPATPL
jgi:tetratricopeptide (TPR) repeat protein